MLTTRLPPHSCPFCRYRLDAATAGPLNPDAQPSAGDVTICIACAGVLIFEERGGRLQLRALGPAEMAEVLSDPQAQAMVAALRLAWKGRQGLP